MIETAMYIDELRARSIHGTAVAVLVAAITAVFSGCGYYARGHPAGDLPNDKVARLNTEDSFFAAEHVTVTRLDGIPTQISGEQNIKIEPGVHMIEVGYLSTNFHSTSSARIIFEAQPGAVYEVQAARIKEGFWSEIAMAAAAFAKGHWIAWVVDQETNEVVGGARPLEEAFTTDLRRVDYPRDQFEITVVEP